MAEIIWKPIVPKISMAQRSKAAVARHNAILRDFATLSSNRLETYPPWRPWKNPPKTGPHAGGRRTGTLGRGWGWREQQRSGVIERIIFENRTPYASFVQGRNQTRHMAARQWPKITDRHIYENALNTAIRRH